MTHQARDAASWARSIIVRMAALYVLLLIFVGLAYMGKVVLDAVLG